MGPRTWQRNAAWFALVAAVLLLTGCPQYGFVDDSTSVSYGPSNRGTLLEPARLPRRGEGYTILPRWAERGLSYGTDELVAVIIYTARRLSALSPGAVLGVADLSRRQGGPSAWHRSHQTGRDADLLFLARDGQGKPVRLQSMLHFRADGSAVTEAADGTERVVYFDVERNWQLVRTLILNPIAEIQYIFVYDPLKQLLLDHARRMGEPEDLVAQASFILHQPSDSLAHDDHFHLRIYCALSDRVVGCHDRGALRWNKKDYKYGDRREVRSNAPLAMGEVASTPMPAMMVLGVLPFVP